MAGTISLSLSQQFDELGNVLARGRLYFYQAGTTSTPQNAYYDSGLTLPFPNPYTLDDAGRIPQFFLADGSIKVILIDRNGIIQINADNVLVIGPSGGGGGGGTVDPTTVLQTGWLQPIYGTGTRTGFVRANGRTIGSATSGATEYANSGAQALFLFLYAEDANLAVSGGRGASAAADWAANKTIALPDFRSRALAGLGDMGNTDNGILSSATFTTGNALTLGSTVGAARRTLTLPQLPTGITSTVTGNVTSSNILTADSPTTGFSTGSSGATVWRAFSNGSTQTIVPTVGVTGSSTSNNTSGSAFDTVSPYMVITIYIKL